MSVRSTAAFCCAGLVVAVGVLQTVALANNTEYFWPAHQKSIEYKVKAHAIRGSVQLVTAEEVTIGDHVYRKVIVTPSPEGLPGQHQVLFLRTDEHGLYARYSASPDAKEVTQLMFPVTEGTSWKTHDQDGNVSNRKIESISDCDIRGTTFEGCVEVSFESPGGAAVAYYAPKFGEIVNSRKNGFMRRSIKVQ